MFKAAWLSGQRERTILGNLLECSQQAFRGSLNIILPIQNFLLKKVLLPHGFTSCRRYCSFVQGKPGTSPPTAQRCGSGHCNLLRHTQCVLHMQRTCMPSQHGVFSTVLWIQGSFQWESRYSCYRNTLFKTSKIPL